MRRYNIENRLKKVIVAPDTTIRETMLAMEHAGMGILLVCHEDRKLVGVVTDGDIRRAMLRKISFENAVTMICNNDPIVIQFPVSSTKALQIMDCNKGFAINNLPVLNAEGQVVDLILRSDLVSSEPLPLAVLVMAGGSGNRLKPLTEELPKPMLQVGNKPILEHIINQLHNSGIHKIKISTNYLSEKIRSYFEDGKKYGVEISYIAEEKPLGTAGSLGMLEVLEEPIIVVNGDILTNVDFGAMYDFHKRHKADLTVGVSQYEFQVPYGVVECKGPHIKRLKEKPIQRFFINAGVYILEPIVHRYVPKEEYYDMTDLIMNVIKHGKTVVSFPIIEYWIDIGQYGEYERANKECSGVFESVKQND